jgi:hypothetical protein
MQPITISTKRTSCLAWYHMGLEKQNLFASGLKIRGVKADIRKVRRRGVICGSCR